MVTLGSVMLGNVDQWCLDWHGPYPGGAVTDPTGPISGAEHILRGTNFGFSDHYVACRAAYRCWAAPDPNYSFSLGFRLALCPVEKWCLCSHDRNHLPNPLSGKESMPPRHPNRALVLTLLLLLAAALGGCATATRTASAPPFASDEAVAEAAEGVISVPLYEVRATPANQQPLACRHFGRRPSRLTKSCFPASPPALGPRTVAF
jgi:hypothetical protein